MTALHPGGCTASALTRRLDTPADRLDLYAALSDGGRRADTMLIETLAGPSLILERAALRIECRGGEVMLEGLTAGGAALLRTVERCLPERIESKGADRLTLRFPRIEGEDAEKRLLSPSPFDVLRLLSTGVRSDTPEEPYAVVLAGAVAFDHVDLFEELPAAAEDPLGFPDFIFWAAESLVVAEPGLAPRLVCSAFATDPEEARRGSNAAAERLADLAERCARAPQPRSFREQPGDAGTVSGSTPLDVARDERRRVDVDLTDPEFADLVARMKAHVLAGDVYQVVPSRTFQAPCADPLAAFAALRALDRSPYMFFLASPDHVLFGASPETSGRVSREGGWPTVEVKPIAGTRPRGADLDEDDRMEAELRLDPKEVAEHMMLVDLARNDVARVAIPGTRRVAQLMTVERYARVMHLVSSVKGVLAIGYDALHALQACLNVGTLSGAPKLKATELIRRYEATKRGPYGGAVGWLAGDGTMDTGVVIRSAVVKDGTAFVRAGAGVVHDSDPAAEAEETRRKAAAILSAIAAAEGGR